VSSPDRPDLIEKVIPTYPPAAKRLLRDDGRVGGGAQARHHDVIIESIAEITPTGSSPRTGVSHDVDVIITEPVSRRRSS